MPWRSFSNSVTFAGNGLVCFAADVPPFVTVSDKFLFTKERDSQLARTSLTWKTARAGQFSVPVNRQNRVFCPLRIAVFRPEGQKQPK
jgi:hypothetical protein